MRKRIQKSDTWSKKDYNNAAKLLRSYGYRTSYKGNRKNSRAVTSRIRRLATALAPYIKNLEGKGKTSRYMQEKFINRDTKFVTQKDGTQKLVDATTGRPLPKTYFNFVFKKLSRQKLKSLKGLVSPSQVTPSGVFLEKPANIKNFDIKIEDGALVYCYGKCKDRVVKISRTALAKDPREAIRKAIGKRKPKGVKLMVNGFLGQRQFSPKEMLYYIESNLLPDFMEDADEGDFVNTFQLRLIY